MPLMAPDAIRGIGSFGGVISHDLDEINGQVCDLA